MCELGARTHRRTARAALHSCRVARARAPQRNQVVELAELDSLARKLAKAKEVERQRILAAKRARSETQQHARATAAAIADADAAAARQQRLVHWLRDVERARDAAASASADDVRPPTAGAPRQATLAALDALAAARQTRLVGDTLRATSAALAAAATALSH